ncbi:MAG: acyl-CoA dehydrogenase, partial [Mycobacterium sp.]|nr:acyl-CoA dehydrogenase [Mycobacterium sp.]
MAEPAEFAFTPEQQQLRTAVRKFSAENFDEATVRRLMESQPRYEPAVWRRLGSELGVLGMSVPESDGGVGGSLVDQAIAVEEFGATLACGPLFGTVYLAIPALVAARAGDARDELLAALVEGERTAAFAVPDTAGAFLPERVTVTADGPGAETTLTGTVHQVVDGDAAGALLVAASGSDGTGLYVVDAGGPGVQRIPLLTMDLTRPQATVEFHGAPARRIAGGEEAERVIGHALQVGAALL